MSCGAGVVVRGPWCADRRAVIKYSGLRTRSGSLSNQSRSSSQTYKIGATSKTPPLPQAAAESPRLHVRRRRHHGSEARAIVSVAGTEAPGAASCDRTRRFPRSGFGLGFPQTVCSPSVSVRLSGCTCERKAFRGILLLKYLQPYSDFQWHLIL